MEKRGLTENDTDKIYRLSDFGGFFLKSDADVIHEFLNRPNELPELMKDYDFAFGAFYYEMGNHEYHINWQADYDVFSCFGNIKYDDSYYAEDYCDQLKFEEVTRRAFKDARNKFYKDAEEKGWY